MYDIKHCFICRPSDSTVSEEAGIDPGTVENLALADALNTRLDFFHTIYVMKTLKTEWKAHAELINW